MQLPELPGYQYEDLLGEDPYGWSFMASHESGERRVVKVLKSQATNESFLKHYLKIFSDREFAIQGTVQVFDYGIEGPDSLTAVATPFFGWKSKDKRWQVASLKRLRQFFQGDQAVEVVGDLARSLSNSHCEGVFHGGLRPASIFVTGDAGGFQDILIGDFGQAFLGRLQYLEAGDLMFYVSPEQLGNRDLSNGLGFKWDVYAFGVIAFQILTGHLPRLERLQQQCAKHQKAFNAAAAISYGGLTPASEHFLNQLEKEKPVEWPEGASDERGIALRSIIESCLEFDVEDRPDSMVEVNDAICRIGDKADKDAASKPVVLASEPTPAERAIIAPPEKAASTVPALEPVVEGVLRDRPASIWQMTAVVAVLCVIPLSILAIKNYQELKSVQAEATIKTSELQASVDEKAEAYLRELAKNRESSEHLQSELNEVENSHSRLLGEAKLARQIVRQTQENGDEFFRIVLDNRDTDVPDFREKRADALISGRKHYENLIEVYGDAPDFMISTANAFFYLGRIYREMGEFGKALVVFGEAERRYVALLEDSRTGSVQFMKNLAVAKRALGQLSYNDGKYAIARHHFSESSRYWTEARSMDSNLSTEAGVSIHENSLSVVECEYAIGRRDAALDATRSVGVQLLKFQESDPENDRVIGALAYSFSLAGRIMEAKGETELATEAYQQSADLYAQAVKLNAAVDEYQLGLGNNLARVGLLSRDMDKLKGAVDILGRVVVHNPFEPSYQKTLADVYGVLARDQRDGGRLSNAIEFEQEAISILQPIVRENGLKTPPDVLYSYSLRLAHLAELLGDGGQFDESRQPLGEAINVLEKISERDNSVASYRRALARARGLAGFACLKAGNKAEAKQHLELAKAEWESYVQANPDDTDAEQAVKWTADQLRGL